MAVVLTVFLAVIGGIWSLRRFIGKGVREVVLDPIRWLRRIWGKGRRICRTISNTLRKMNIRIRFYLLKRGVMKMKVNLNVIPEVSRTWSETYLDGKLAKAGFLASKMVKFLSVGDANQQTNKPTVFNSWLVRRPRLRPCWWQILWTESCFVRWLRSM